MVRYMERNARHNKQKLSYRFVNRITKLQATLFLILVAGNTSLSSNDLTIARDQHGKGNEKAQ